MGVPGLRGLAGFPVVGCAWTGRGDTTTGGAVYPPRGEVDRWWPRGLTDRAVGVIRWGLVLLPRAPLVGVPVLCRGEVRGRMPLSCNARTCSGVSGRTRPTKCAGSGFSTTFGLWATEGVGVRDANSAASSPSRLMSLKSSGRSSVRVVGDRLVADAPRPERGEMGLPFLPFLAGNMTAPCARRLRTYRIPPTTASNTPATTPTAMPIVVPWDEPVSTVRTTVPLPPLFAHACCMAATADPQQANAVQVQAHGTADDAAGAALLDGDVPTTAADLLLVTDTSGAAEGLGSGAADWNGGIVDGLADADTPGGRDDADAVDVGGGAGDGDALGAGGGDDDGDSGADGPADTEMDGLADGDVLSICSWPFQYKYLLLNVAL